MATVVFPIWKDTYVSFGPVDSQAFIIRTRDNGEVIYSGKAYRRPSDTDLKIKVNDICADHIKQPLPPLSTSKCYPHTLARLFDILDVSDTGTTAITETVSFFNDWSYDYSRPEPGVSEKSVLSDPITGKVTAQMSIPVSIYCNSAVETMQILDAQGNETGTYGLSMFGDFLNNDNFNKDFFKSDPPQAADGGVYIYNLQQVLALHPSARYLKVAGITYEIVTGDYKYALYYMNAYGGWDCFLVEGGNKTTDNYSRSTFKREYDNSMPENRSTVNYMTSVSRTIDLGTGWLSDEQSAKMHHLIGATEVYLYDMETAELRPVVIKTNSLVRKTHRNNGYKLVRYDFNVELAQEMIRK